MEKITLKLTDAEYKLLNDNKLIDSIQYVSGYSSRVWVDILVKDIDKFRKFLIDEIRYYKSEIDFDVDMVQVELNNLESILSKLDRNENK